MIVKLFNNSLKKNRFVKYFFWYSATRLSYHFLRPAVLRPLITQGLPFRTVAFLRLNYNILYNDVKGLQKIKRERFHIRSLLINNKKFIFINFFHF